MFFCLAVRERRRLNLSSTCDRLDFLGFDMLKTVLLTGVSTVFGRECAKEALRRGYRVIGAVSAQEEAHAFEAQSYEAFPCRANITDRRGMLDLVADVEREMAPVDVLIVAHECRGGGPNTFDVKVFVPMGLTRVIRPNKFALDDVSELLATAVAPLGICVTLVPASRSRVLSDRRDVLAELPMLHLKCRDQPNDPGRASRCLFDCIESEEPPLPLYLGFAALRIVRSELVRLYDDGEEPARRLPRRLLAGHLVSTEVRQQPERS